jgi:hypothetical protein
MYGTASAFAGSCSVMALKCKSVFAGHCALTNATAFFTSFGLIGARGWTSPVLAVRVGSDVETVSTETAETFDIVTKADIRRNAINQAIVSSLQMSRYVEEREYEVVNNMANDWQGPDFDTRV